MPGRILAMVAASAVLLAITLPGLSAPDRHWLGPPAIGRIRVEVAGERITVTTDVTLPVRPGLARALELHAAYAAPGTPLASEAELVATPRGFLVAPAAARGRRIESEQVLAASPASDVVLGRARMAGRRIRATASELETALAPAGLATLRLRELRALPAKTSNRAHQLLIRLGAFDKAPLLVGSIELEGPGITRQQAQFCGPEAKPQELWLDPPRAGSVKRIAPSLAARSASDDLCIDFWRTP